MATAVLPIDFILFDSGPALPSTQVICPPLHLIAPCLAFFPPLHFIICAPQHCMPSLTTFRNHSTSGYGLLSGLRRLLRKRGPAPPLLALLQASMIRAYVVPLQQKHTKLWVIWVWPEFAYSLVLPAGPAAPGAAWQRRQRGADFQFFEGHGACRSLYPACFRCHFRALVLSIDRGRQPVLREELPPLYARACKSP